MNKTTPSRSNLVSSNEERKFELNVPVEWTSGLLLPDIDDPSSDSVSRLPDIDDSLPIWELH